MIDSEAKPATVVATTQAAIDVLAERRRQIEVEGWTPEHDDALGHGELVYAAASYAIQTRVGLGTGWQRSIVERLWPFSSKWWKPGNVRRMLVKAAALIIAEIERLDRKAAADALNRELAS